MAKSVMVRTLHIIHNVLVWSCTELPVEDDDSDDLGIAAIIGIIIAFIAAVTLSILAIAVIVDILYLRRKQNKRAYIVR